MQNESQCTLPSFLQPSHTHLLSGSPLPISVTRSNRLCRRFSVVQIAKLGNIAFLLELLVQHALSTILVDKNPLKVTTNIIISSKSSSFQFSSSFSAICIRPCSNGGNCTKPNTCSCQSGYNGSQCQTGKKVHACLGDVQTEHKCLLSFFLQQLHA